MVSVPVAFVAIGFKSALESRAKLVDGSVSEMFVMFRFVLASPEFLIVNINATVALPFVTVPKLIVPLVFGTFVLPAP